MISSRFVPSSGWVIHVTWSSLKEISFGWFEDILDSVQETSSTYKKKQGLDLSLLATIISIIIEHGDLGFEDSYMFSLLNSTRLYLVSYLRVFSSILS
jgi:hypothetical protein